MEHVPAYFCLLESDHKEKDSLDKILVQKSSINRKYAAWLNPSPVELGFISFRSQSEAREVLYGDLFGRGIALVKLVRWKIFGRGHDRFLFNVDLLCQGPDTHRQRTITQTNLLHYFSHLLFSLYLVFTCSSLPATSLRQRAQGSCRARSRQDSPCDMSCASRSSPRTHVTCSCAIRSILMSLAPSVIEVTNFVNVDTGGEIGRASCRERVYSNV